jgi:hypothetical protein
LFADQPSLLAGKMLLALILYPLGRSIGDLAIIVISVGVYLLRRATALGTRTQKPLQNTLTCNARALTSPFRDVRIGQKADLTARKSNFRFTLKADSERTSRHARHTYLSFSEASDWTFAIASTQPVDAADLFSSRQVAMRPSPGFIFPHTPLTSALQAIKPSFRASAAA